MKRFKTLAVVAAAVILTACGTTQVKTTTNDYEPIKGAKTLLVKPDVELKVLLATGITETRADWSNQGVTNLAEALETGLSSYGGQVETMDLADDLSPRQLQIVKLNDAVVTTSITYDYAGFGLPTHEDTFSRTLGPGASVLAGSSGADYALMVKAAGSYSSGGKVAMNIAMAALGGPIQTGSQTLFASLVDLNTGDIVWSNLATAGANADMREADGARVLVENVLKSFPLNPDSSED